MRDSFRVHVGLGTRGLIYVFIMCWWWRISGLGIVSGGLMWGCFRTGHWLDVLVLAVAAGVGEVVVACW